MPNTPNFDWLISSSNSIKDLSQTIIEYCVFDLLKRPTVTYAKLAKLGIVENPVLDPQVQEQIDIQIKYAGYINRQTEEIMRSQRSEEQTIPSDFDYTIISGLSKEIVEKLSKTKPQTIGQAMRISGVTPAAISLLVVHLKKNRGSGEQ